MKWEKQQKNWKNVTDSINICIQILICTHIYIHANIPERYMSGNKSYNDQRKTWIRGMNSRVAKDNDEFCDIEDRFSENI
jgi:hypothetical protein